MSRLSSNIATYQKGTIQIEEREPLEQFHESENDEHMYEIKLVA
jgi:hypothetical protein